MQFAISVKDESRKYQECISLLDYILTKARQCYQIRNRNYIPIIERVADSDRVTYRNGQEELLKTGSFFPNHPYIRKIGRITVGKNHEGSTCNHSFKEAGQLGAGTVIYWCAEHRQCLGFSVLQAAESSCSIFNTLITRFNPMPSVIIYDNGCNLHDYIMNRAPNFFKNTLIYSDGFHWKGHNNCSLNYNSKLYSFLEHVSTVLHEQKNALLYKLKRTSVHMGYESFCEFLVYIIHSLNQEENRKTTPIQTLQL
ncbi:hypothetical protein BC833DRAFT_532166 [Globomyces pollinis-pini]|nr:hypothetical protein BC833DRAFT_532166 [Globomyces pollinis-pini]